MIQIAGIPSVSARKVWPVAGPWVQAALDAVDTMTSADFILERIEARDMQLWLVLADNTPVAAFTTEIVVYEKGKMLTAFSLAGDGMDVWLPAVLETLAAFARANDCRGVQCSGREGWARKLAAFGWTKASVNMVKEL